jgi:HlyD family secretion protein
MKKRNVIIVSSIVIVSVAAYLFFKKNNSENISWRMAQVERGDVKITITATGTINADTTVNVGTQVSGTIAKLYADFNTVVKQGDVIAVLDTTFLAAAVEDASATAQKAQIAVEQSKRDFDRTEELYKQKVAAQTDYELARTTYETNKNNLRSALAQLNRAKINLQYATIKAPISGIVISRQVDVGQTVAASFNTPTLFVIANNLKRMQVQATIDETDIGQVKLGQEVSFTVDAYPNDSFAGKVDQIRLQPVTVQNVVNYIVIISAPNPEMKLMPGMTANIIVKVEEHKDVMKVSAGALKFTPPAENGNGNAHADSLQHHHGQNKHDGRLWAVQGDSLVKKHVTTGLSDGTFTEINGDIKAGDWVITGINTTEEAAQQSQNPFMPRMRFGRTPTRRSQ